MGCSWQSKGYDRLNKLNIKEVNLQPVEYVLQEDKKVGGICYNITLGEYSFTDHAEVEIRIAFPEEQNNTFGTAGDTVKIPNKLLQSDTVQIYTNLIETDDQALIQKLINNTKEVKVELMIDGETVDSDMIEATGISG